VKRRSTSVGVDGDDAVDELHDVELRADDRLVVADGVWSRHGEAGRLERGDDRELAVHVVRSRLDVREGRPADDPGAAVFGLDAVGDVGAPVPDDARGEALDRLNVGAEPRREVHEIDAGG
jgi:hypothetical protein